MECFKHPPWKDEAPSGKPDRWLAQPSVCLIKKATVVEMSKNRVEVNCCSWNLVNNNVVNTLFCYLKRNFASVLLNNRVLRTLPAEVESNKGQILYYCIEVDFSGVILEYFGFGFTVLGGAVYVFSTEENKIKTQHWIFVIKSVHVHVTMNALFH